MIIFNWQNVLKLTAFGFSVLVDVAFIVFGVIALFHFDIIRGLGFILIAGLVCYAIVRWAMQLFSK